MNIKTKFSARAQAGLGMVEILVGMLIGMIGIIVVFSVLSVAEERKRTAASGSDAQASGTVAILSIERDIKLAGYGFGGAGQFNLLGCKVHIYSQTHGPQNFTRPLVPVKIDQGAGGGPDTIWVLYGNSPLVASSQTAKGEGQGPEYITPGEGRAPFQNGDLVLVGGQATGSTDCPDNAGISLALVEITNTEAPSARIEYIHNATYTTPGGATKQAAFNRSGGPDVPADFKGGFLYNLGPFPRLNVWAINNGTLTVTEDLHGTATVTVGDDIVDLQAQYGVNTAADTAAPAIAWQDADPDDWRKVRAIRLAVLARSDQWERDAVTTVAPTWSGGGFTMSAPADGTNWQNYRYKVFETVLPLRNMLWGENQ